MKRKNMIKDSHSFDEIIKTGKNISNKYFRIFYLEKENCVSKFGLAVGKKIGNAVIRNHVKRQLRSIIDKNNLLFSNDTYYIIMVKKAYLDEKYAVLENEFRKLIEKVNK